MKPHLAEAAADRLARAADDAPMAEEEVLRVLARIARTGKPGDRLRAAELIGKQLGMFRDAAARQSRPDIQPTNPETPKNMHSRRSFRQDLSCRTQMQVREQD